MLRVQIQVEERMVLGWILETFRLEDPDWGPPEMKRHSGILSCSWRAVCHAETGEAAILVRMSARQEELEGGFASQEVLQSCVFGLPSMLGALKYE